MEMDKYSSSFQCSCEGGVYLTCTESYGGECPNCGYRKIFLRYGSDGNFQFDACPKCGFAYGCNGYDEPMEGADFWENSPIIKMFEDMLKRQKLPLTRSGLYRLTKTWDDNYAEVGNVFQYKKKDIERIMGKLKEKVQFT